MNILNIIQKTGLALLIVVGLFSCESGGKYYKYSGEIQGTYFSVIYEAEKDLAPQIDSLLDKFNQSLNNYDDSSLISRLNRNETQNTDSIFRTMFRAAREVWEQSGNRFDITIAPLANAWGFGYESGHFPDSAQVDSILQFVGMNKIHLDNGLLVKDDPRVTLIGNAIAQGMSVDYLAWYLDKQQLDNYLVEIGGEVRAKGESQKGKPWLVGIDKPIIDSMVNKRELQTAIELDNLAVATSGNYRKFREHDGKRYGHSLNPKNGYPEKNNVLSATVVQPQCMYADAWATAFMMMDMDEALQVAEQKEHMEVMLITQNADDDFDVHFSSGFRKFIP